MRNTGIQIALVFMAISAHAQLNGTSEFQPKGDLRSYFLGAWKLVSTEVRYPDGHTAPFPDLGPNAVGFLFYTPSGHMCAELMKPGRPEWKDVEHPTPTEAASALDGFNSYCGTFEISESDRTMIHHPQTAWSPGWVGSVQIRPYHLVSADRFFFRGEDPLPPQSDGTKGVLTWTITWERLK